MSKHYDALERVAGRLSLPTSYASDLTVHDRATLDKRDASLPFGWCLRDGGTHLFIPGARDGVGHTVDQFPGFVADAERGCGPCHWFWWDGERLERVRRPSLERKLREAR
jgi:hypothetical protein